MQRRVGKHHAELSRGGRDGMGHRSVRPAWRQHDRALAGGQQGPGRVVELNELESRLDRGDHQRKRLVLTVLPCPELGHHGLVVRPAGEVIAAQALDGDDPALRQRDGDSLERRFVAFGRGAAGSIHEPQRRTAVGTGVRLGVEPPVERVLVLGAAAGAHLECRHRGQRPVVGNAADDREPRPAVGAVREGVPVTTVRRVHQLGEAGLTGRDVGGDGGLGRTTVRAFRDPEVGLTRRGDPLIGDPLDDRERRRLGPHPAKQLVEPPAFPLGLDHDASRIVQHPAAEAKVRREPVDEGPKADALHCSLHTHADPLTRPDGHPSSISSRSA